MVKHVAHGAGDHPQAGKEHSQQGPAEEAREPVKAAIGSAAEAVKAVPDALAGDGAGLAAAVAVGVGAALIEIELLPGILIGAGAVLLARRFPQIGQALKPAVKSAIGAGLAMSDKARRVMAEASEQVQDVVAEVRSERGTQQAESKPAMH
jgi:hypothetical protein